MSFKEFSTLEIDAIGEILNISLGSSATALSTMLSTRTDITTPQVQVVVKDEFEFDDLEPAIGVEITYIEGLRGSNIMLLKRVDVKLIVEMMMGFEIPDEEFELNEINLSAICEAMNQMMGASATALSEFLGETVNISTPTTLEITDAKSFKEQYFADEDVMVSVEFMLRIGDSMESKFINLMPTDLAKKLVSGFFPGEASDMDTAPAADQASAQDEGPADEPAPVAAEESSNHMMSQEEIEALLAGGLAKEEAPAPTPAPAVQPAPAPAPAVQPAPVPAGAAPAPAAAQPQVAASPLADQMVAQMAQMTQMMSQMQQVMMNQMQQQAAAQNAPAGPKTLNVHPLPTDSFGGRGGAGEEQEENIDMIMGVPLEVSVEIGRTRKLVKDILEFTKGSLVVLDKVAGEQVDLFVNGQCIAKGDVVVVEDNFGIRITEILAEDIPVLE